MSFDNRLHLLTLKGCMIASLLMPLAVEGYAQGNLTTTSQQTEQQQLRTLEPAATQPQQDADSKYYKVSCDHPKQREDADLCEQRRMANAAEDAVWWASIQTKFGIAGFGAVLLSLIFTGWAAVAASQQVRLSRRSLIDTNRALVFPKGTLWKAVTHVSTGRINAWKMAVTWENLGKTATRHLRLGINRIITPAALPDDFDFPDRFMGQPVPLLIAPGHTIESSEIPFTMEEMQSIVDGTAHLYVWGWAEYDDVFERTPRHRTEFCYKWNLGGDINDIDHFGSRYNVHDRHNGADDDCEMAFKTLSSKGSGGR